MVLGTSRKGHAAAAPDRRADGTGTGTTGALLAPRLLATATHVGTILLGTGTLTTTGQIGGDDLVHQGLIEFFAKGGIGYFDSTGACTCKIQIHR